MKKWIMVIICMTITFTSLILLFHFNNKFSDKVNINYKNSFFNDFYINNGEVFVQCKIYFLDSSILNQKFKLRAYFPEDVQSGFLKDTPIYAIDDNGNIKTFELTSESVFNSVDVVFKGYNNGYPSKDNRLLPEIEVVYIEQ